MRGSHENNISELFLYSAELNELGMFVLSNFVEKKQFTQMGSGERF